MVFEFDNRPSVWYSVVSTLGDFLRLHGASSDQQPNLGKKGEVMATILLTGATGTVGSSLAPLLKERGAQASLLSPRRQPCCPA